MRAVSLSSVILPVALWTFSLPMLCRPYHAHPAPEKLGKVIFPTSCGPATQRDFERAVALLHSFAYTVAEEAFRRVAEMDPGCAMAYWGMAMTHYHQLWEPSLPAAELEEAQGEIRKAQQIGGDSNRERQYIAGLALIYRDADHVPYDRRSTAYKEAMAELARSNPADSESQIFYALALVSTAPPADMTHGNQKQAAQILEPLFRKYPQHPGIAHYLIHSYDNPEFAKRGLSAARAYSKIAPSAPHALHMPSHIFTRLGLWHDSIASNLAARDAAFEQRDVGEELHAMDYLMYAYLQCGRDQDAANLLRDLSRKALHSIGEFKVGYAAAAMPVRYAVELRKWTDAAALNPLPGSAPQVAAVTLWARALGLARGARQPAAANREIDRLELMREKLRADGNVYWATQVEVQAHEARAWLAHAEGRQDEALSLMRDAAREEDAVEKLPVTPGPIIPAREQLGDLLIELNRPKEALREFETALTAAPLRRGALLGASRARGACGRAGEGPAL